MSNFISWLDDEGSHDSSIESIALRDDLRPRGLASSLAFGELTKHLPVNSELPELVLLHGITDCHLAHVEGIRRTRIWLDPFKLVLGQYSRRLTLENDGVSDATGNCIEPDGILQKKYSTALQAWRQAGFATHAFCYDWRKSTLASAGRLGQFLTSLPFVQSGRKVVLVCHSMGGLVAAAYAARTPDWNNVVQHCIFIGSPLAGSYSAALAIMGQSESFAKMDRYSVSESLEDFQRMAASFPGLVDLLPSPEIFPESEPLFEVSHWSGRVCPDSHWLTQSRQLKTLIWSSPIFSASTHLISQGLDTVAKLTWQDNQRTYLPSHFSQLGDGTVLNRSSLHPDLKAYKVSGEHGMLCTEPDVCKAVVQIASQQPVELPELKLADLDREQQVTTPDHVRAGVLFSAVEASSQDSLDLRCTELSSFVFSQDTASSIRRSESEPLKVDPAALLAGGFGWKNLLSMAIASEQAYERVIAMTRSIATSKWGFSECLMFDKGDTQGFVAWDDDIVLISYRGSEKSVGDWLGNLNLAWVTFPQFGRVHRGFAAAFEDARPELEQYLDVADAHRKKIWITGHSLGGALAVLAGAHYATAYDIAGIVTFGQPKVGQRPLSDYFRAHLNGKYYRVVNNRDVVATIPPNYSHFGRLVQFNEAGRPLGEARTVSLQDIGAFSSDAAAPADVEQPTEIFELDETQFFELQRMLNASQSSDPSSTMSPSMMAMRSSSWLERWFGLSIADHSITQAYIPILCRLV